MEENAYNINEPFEEFEQENNEDIEVVEDNAYDVSTSQQLQTIIELQTSQNNLLAQVNANQLFLIGCTSAIIVCLVLYNAIKKFI